MSKAEIEKGSGNLGAWIPQLFYDIIARIIPGFFVLLILLLSILDFQQFIYYFKKVLFVDNLHDLSTNLLVLLGICVSYITAIILRATGSLLLHPIYKRKKEKIDPESELKSREIHLSELGVSECDDNYKTNDIALRYDFIKLNDIVNGNRITKLKAEVQMSGILFTGALIASVIDFILFFTDHSHSRWIILGSTALMCIFCLRAKKHFSERLKMAVLNCSVMLGFPESGNHLKDKKSKSKKLQKLNG